MLSGGRSRISVAMRRLASTSTRKPSSSLSSSARCSAYLSVMESPPDAQRLTHAPIVAGPQLPSQQLAYGRLRNPFYEHIFLRAFEAREPGCSAVRIERVLTLLPLREFHERDELLTPAIVRHADDGHPSDRRCAGQHVFHLLGIHILSTRDHHVVDASGDVKLSVLIKMAEIAGEVPTAAQRFGCCVRPLPVTGERLRTREAGNDLSGIAARHDIIGRG